MVAKRVGSPDEVKVTAARAVSSGHLHEAGDGRTGYYGSAMDADPGDTISLSTHERLELDAAAFAATSAGDNAVFDFATQTLVASGGTTIGKYVLDKALNATTAVVQLNRGV